MGFKGKKRQEVALTKPSTPSGYKHQIRARAELSVKAHHRVNSPNTGRNFGGRWIKKE